ncbi:MAG: hypothetical protein DME15_06115 [Candidatus Rokuibacteriota bacterium]|nr:MAG: hypothetical protein DME15_06115 [Candidatus Rokubacteria bacterium]
MRRRATTGQLTTAMATTMLLEDNTVEHGELHEVGQRPVFAAGRQRASRAILTSETASQLLPGS